MTPKVITEFLFKQASELDFEFVATAVAAFKDPTSLPSSLIRSVHRTTILHVNKIKTV